MSCVRTVASMRSRQTCATQGRTKNGTMKETTKETKKGTKTGSMSWVKSDIIAANAIMTVIHVGCRDNEHALMHGRSRPHLPPYSHPPPLTSPPKRICRSGVPFVPTFACHACKRHEGATHAIRFTLPYVFCSNCAIAPRITLAGVRVQRAHQHLLRLRPGLLV